MIVKVTKEAEERMASTDKPIRINGELVGGCGMNVEYALWWDSQGPEDEVYQVDSLTFLLDRETIAYIGSDLLTIDYRAQQGFRMVTPQQILAYGLQLKERWS
ncbi:MULTISPECIES: iron-sulfur cluster biosynthesis family protein [Brevibacillus]|uniref:iron-sulfur cluster biosynthesis family protein n=1 Tax=Brevibacillus TaxID=55080 RepID=UPI001F5B3426|nr:MULTISPECIES: iron-sulfur cluster biosynthesis family protein [Brevibacillus]